MIPTPPTYTERLAYIAQGLGIALPPSLNATEEWVPVALMAIVDELGQRYRGHPMQLQPDEQERIKDVLEGLGAQMAEDQRLSAWPLPVFEALAAKIADLEAEITRLKGPMVQ